MKRDFPTPFVVCLLAISGSLPIFSASKQTSVSLAACKVRHAYTLPRVHYQTYTCLYIYTHIKSIRGDKASCTLADHKANRPRRMLSYRHSTAGCTRIEICAVRRNRYEPHLPTAPAVSLSLLASSSTGCLRLSFLPYPTLSHLALPLPRTRLQATSIKMRAIRYNLIGYAGRVNSSDDTR